MTIEAASGQTIADKLNPTYQTGGKCMCNMNYTLEWFHHSVIVSSKISEGPCLLLEDCDDRFHRITIFEFPSERIFNQFHPCLFFIVV